MEKNTCLLYPNRLKAKLFQILLIGSLIRLGMSNLYPQTKVFLTEQMVGDLEGDKIRTR